MSVGFFQLIAVLLLALILFGKFPTIFSDFSKGLNNIKNFLSNHSEELRELESKDSKSINKKTDQKSNSG